jgi:squalene-associated FAD-dependent desaturase
MHLAKHGCETWLIESRNRLGGRVGSFTDPKSEQPIDYCQHVGMRCCSELVRWIKDLGQEDQWQEQSTLWFRSSRGKRFLAQAWPLPPPLHLSGLLLKWPDLGLIDRAVIAMGLAKLIRTRPDDKFNDMLAIDWLRHNRQTSTAIESFWSTILVSALGEQLPRITMGAVYKVIIDGFAASKDAYHLLVPQKSLSQLVDKTAKDCLNRLGVRVVEGKTVTGLLRSQEGNWKLQTRATADAPTLQDDFHAVVVAVPWHRLEGILDPKSTWMQPDDARWIQEVQKLESAPITGIHTWWNKPWFNDPHAILINRLSQWIFPGPNESRDDSIGETIEHYYQVVISGSRDLPKGDSETILRMVQEDLREVFEELRNSGAVMTRGKVITDPQSVFSVNDRHNQARLQCNTFGAQGIFLAGDWVQTGWPATMEGALRSGSLAAGSLLSYVGRPANRVDALGYKPRQVKAADSGCCVWLRSACVWRWTKSP